MQKKLSLFKALACVLLLAFSVTLIPLPVSAADDVSAATPTLQVHDTSAGVNNLYPHTALASRYDSPSQPGNILVAQNTASGAGQKADAPAEAKADQSCCGDFWDVHFGGYRWAWWALAGAGLIAIHAN